ADVVRVVSDQLSSDDVQAIITTGGTGLTSRDSTYEAITTLMEKRLDGFGELFRMLSYHDIGPAAMLTRAVAGTARGKVIVSLPGSEGAVRLGVTKLLLPEIGHLVQQVAK
ncbi:MAG: molybdenum cofactor biosynthesis protein MoaB, partial [Acidobacteria bacterium]|nr:molybdenum cofactor biosynthesis protein MoaB [Acidobacteriota bacterium]